MPEWKMNMADNADAEMEEKAVKRKQNEGRNS